MTTRSRAGFTLIEVLGVVLVTALLLGTTVSFYINLTRQATRASEHTRTIRRAGALLDRVANDLEHTLLVTRSEEDEDSLANPYVFLAESRLGQNGSDQIKFVRRELPRATEGNPSDLAMVAYTLQRSAETEHLELRRWETTELPESLVREFPASDDPASLLVADDLTHFSLQFLDETGNWKDRWDSSQLVESDQLPLLVRIAVGLVDPNQPEQALALTDELPLYTRDVALPIRPIDLAALLNPDEEEGDGAGEQEEGEGEDLTVGKCIDASKLPIAGMPGLSPSQVAEIAAAIRSNPDAPFAPYAGLLGGMDVVREECR